MKKICTLFGIILCLCLTLNFGQNFSVRAEELFWDKDTSVSVLRGDGTGASPYLIASAGELAYVMRANNNFTPIGEEKSKFHGKVLMLEADIDLAGKLWTPIGTEVNPFQGTFLGSGHVVKNISFKDVVAAGLFGNINAAVIEAVGIRNLQVVIGSKEVPFHKENTNLIGVGSVAVRANGKSTMKNCFVDMLQEVLPDGSGLVNVYDSKIEIYTKHQIIVGGLVAILDDGSLIKNSYTNVGIKVEASASQVDNCIVGGIVGENRGGNIFNTLGYGGVEVQKKGTGAILNLGGIVGSNSSAYANVINNVYSGLLKTTDAGAIVGSICGLNSLGANVEYCKAYEKAYSVLIGKSQTGNDLQNSTFSEITRPKTLDFYQTSDWESKNEWDFKTIWETSADGFPKLQNFKIFVYRGVNEAEYVDLRFIYFDKLTDKKDEIEKAVDGSILIPYGKTFYILARIDDTFVDYSKFYELSGLIVNNKVVDVVPIDIIFGESSYKGFEMVSNNASVGEYNVSLISKIITNIISVQKYNVGTVDEPSYDENTGFVKSDNSSINKQELKQVMSFGSEFTYSAIAGPKYGFAYWAIDYIEVSPSGEITVIDTIIPSESQEHEFLFKSSIKLTFGKGFFVDMFRLRAVFSDNTKMFKMAFNEHQAEIYVSGEKIKAGEEFKIVKGKTQILEIKVFKGYAFDVDRFVANIYKMFDSNKVTLKSFHNKEDPESSYEDFEGNMVYKVHFNTDNLLDIEKPLVIFEANFTAASENGGIDLGLVIGLTIGGIALLAGGIGLTIFLIKKKKTGGFNY